MGEQAEIPGIERPHGDRTLDALLVEQKKLSKARKKAQDTELENTEKIVRRMREKEFDVYEHRNHNPVLVARLTTKDKVTVKAEDSNTVEVDASDEG
jgi:hypothetical protein